MNADHEADVSLIVALEAERLLRRVTAAMTTPSVRWLASREVREWAQRAHGAMTREARDDA